MPRHKSDGSQAEASRRRRRRRRRRRQCECCVSVRRDGVSSGYRRRAIVSSARLGVVRDPATKASLWPASSRCTLASLVATMQTFGLALCWSKWLRTRWWCSCVSLLCLCVCETMMWTAAGWRTPLTVQGMLCPPLIVYSTICLFHIMTTLLFEFL